MTDLIERRLISAAQRWQAEQPAPPVVPLDRLDEAPANRAGWRAALATAAAVALVGGGTAAALRVAASDHAAPSDSTGTPTQQVQRADQVVPWRDLPARHPRIAHRSHGRLVTPFDNLMANGEIRGHLHPGDILRFVVYLESFTDVSLKPCPDYTIAFGAGHAVTRQLNCEQVPYRQVSRAGPPSSGVVRLAPGRGHPVLPANTKVVFAMQVRVPDLPGRQKVLWTIDGPSAMPGFYGIVHVSRS